MGKRADRAARIGAFTRRGFLGAVGLGVAGCFGGRAVARARRPKASAKRPNIVILLADDMGWGDVGCYNAESRIPTPRMDALALQGIRFSDAHSPSAVCTPTRYGMLTGRYCWRSRLKQVVFGGFDRPLVEPDRMTLPGMLKQNGYATACVGMRLPKPGEMVQLWCTRWKNRAILGNTSRRVVRLIDRMSAL